MNGFPLAARIMIEPELAPSLWSSSSMFIPYYLGNSKPLLWFSTSLLSDLYVHEVPTRMILIKPSILSSALHRSPGRCHCLLTPIREVVLCLAYFGREIYSGHQHIQPFHEWKWLKILVPSLLSTPTSGKTQFTFVVFIYLVSWF